MSFFSKKQNLGFAAIILAISTLLSRLMGLIRDKVISWQFGASSEADMYFAAFVIPDIINYLLAGGFMSITIIPLFAKRLKENVEDAWKFFSCILSWMTVLATILTLIAILNAEYLAKIIAPGFNEIQKLRLAFFMKLVLPAQIFFLIGTCFTSILYIRRQFQIPALSPLIYNGAIILFGVLWPLIFSAKEGMTGYCVGVSIGAFFGAFLLPIYMVYKGGLTISINFKHNLLHKFLIIALPLMLGQTVIMLDEQFLRVFGSLVGDGQVSLLNYARRISQVPVGLVGQAAAVASYPFLVNLLAQGDKITFNQTLNKAFKNSLTIIIPCAFYMVATAYQIISIIFQGGNFIEQNTINTVPLAQIMLSMTPFWIFYMILVRAYYAEEDTLTPAVTGTILTIVIIPIYLYIAIPYGSFAIALTSGISVAIYTIWLTIIWIKRHDSSPFKGILPHLLKLFIAVIPSTILAYMINDASYDILNSYLPFTGLTKTLIVSCLTSLWSLIMFLGFFVPIAKMIKIRIV